VVLALIVLAGPGCGSATPTATATLSASPVTSLSPSPVHVPPSSSPTDTAPAAHLVNKTGHFSFDYRPNWVFVNCDPATPGVGLAIRAGDAVHTTSCGNEACYFSVLITSVPGDQTNDAPSKVGCMQYVSGRATTTVKVDGATGTRSTDTFTAGPDKTGGFGPDPGTEQVLYAVYNGTLTYYALYQRLPKQPDETAAFDELMASFLFT